MMADYGRYGDDQTRDRESSRYGRGMDESRGWWGGGDRDRGWQHVGDTARGWGRDRDERGDWDQGGGRRHDRSERMFGRGRDEDDGSDRSERGGRGDRSRHGGGDHFGYDDRHEGLPINETSRLIASNKVEGTVVYARDGARLGSIYNFMVDKRSGKVEYAVMSYGGFLGMGTRYYPLPWDILSYDTRLGGYHVDMVERDLERAPSFDRSNEPSFDTSYGRHVRGWYGLRG
jgi:hypothetical protein